MAEGAPSPRRMLYDCSRLVDGRVGYPRASVGLGLSSLLRLCLCPGRCSRLGFFPLRCSGRFESVEDGIHYKRSSAAWRSLVTLPWHMEAAFCHTPPSFNLHSALGLFNINKDFQLTCES